MDNATCRLWLPGGCTTTGDTLLRSGARARNVTIDVGAQKRSETAVVGVRGGLRLTQRAGRPSGGGRGDDGRQPAPTTAACGNGSGDFRIFVHSRPGPFRC